MRRSMWLDILSRARHLLTGVCFFFSISLFRRTFMRISTEYTTLIHASERELAVTIAITCNNTSGPPRFLQIQQICGGARSSVRTKAFMGAGPEGRQLSCLREGFKPTTNGKYGLCHEPGNGSQQEKRPWESNSTPRVPVNSGPKLDSHLGGMLQSGIA